MKQAQVLQVEEQSEAVLQIETLTEKQANQKGYALAKALAEADFKAGMTKRELLITTAEKYAIREDNAKGIIAGIVKYHTDEGHEKSTVAKAKSEAKTVFDAARRHEIAGITRMREMQGGYNEFITFCRTMRDEGKPAPSRQSGKREKTKLTEVQQAEVHARIGEASQEQLVAIATDAVKNVLTQASEPTRASLAGKNTLLVIQAQATALAKSNKVEPFFRQVAEAILAVVHPALEQLAKVEEVARATQKMAEGEKLAA